MWEKEVHVRHEQFVLFRAFARFEEYHVISYIGRCRHDPVEFILSGIVFHRGRDIDTPPFGTKQLVYPLCVLGCGLGSLDIHSCDPP